MFGLGCSSINHEYYVVIVLLCSKPQRRSQSHMIVHMSSVCPSWPIWSCTTAATLPGQPSSSSIRPRWHIFTPTNTYQATTHYIKDQIWAPLWTDLPWSPVGLCIKRCYTVQKPYIDWRSLVLQLTFAGGERRTEVFVHSLELGHTAGTRAIKAMGECDTQAEHTLIS